MGLKWVNICFIWCPEFLCEDGALQQMYKHRCGNYSARSFFNQSPQNSGTIQLLNMWGLEVDSFVLLLFGNHGDK